MAPYLASQIIASKLQYKQMVARYPQFKEQLDAILRERGHAYLIEE